jgi:hypothetical protein
MDNLNQAYQAVWQRIRQAEAQACRTPNSVQLLAVSKTKPIEAINALAELGQRAFGENYLQESLDKIALRPDLEWHFIGPIQSNKTRPIAEHFDWVESIDRLKIAQRLSEQRPPNRPPIQALLQVNISREASKSGFLPEDFIAQVEPIMALAGLQIRGLMAIPQVQADVEKQRVPFAQLRALLLQMQQRWPQARLDTLSMGMSADLEAAIWEGTTQVRIGTDLFGARGESQKLHV